MENVIALKEINSNEGSNAGGMQLLMLVAAVFSQACGFYTSVFAFLCSRIAFSRQLLFTGYKGSEAANQVKSPQFSFPASYTVPLRYRDDTFPSLAMLYAQQCHCSRHLYKYITRPQAIVLVFFVRCWSIVSWLLL